jgi:hypothetical protein
MATNPEQKPDEAKPEGKKPKAERQAKVSKLTSRGSEYTQLWLSRDVGDKLAKGKVYHVEVGKFGVLTLTPQKAAKS